MADLSQKDKLNKIVEHMNRWNVSFGFGNPLVDSVVLNIISQPIAIDRFSISDEKISRLTTYCLFDKFVDSYQTSTDIYIYLNNNRIIDEKENIKIINVFPPVQVTMKQNKVMFVVEFELIGL